MSVDLILKCNNDCNDRSIYVVLELSVLGLSDRFSQQSETLI